jgi:hypothetical protein
MSTLSAVLTRSQCCLSHRRTSSRRSDVIVVVVIVVIIIVVINFVIVVIFVVLLLSTLWSLLLSSLLLLLSFVLIIVAVPSSLLSSLLLSSFLADCYICRCPASVATITVVYCIRHHPMPLSSCSLLHRHCQHLSHCIAASLDVPLPCWLIVALPTCWQSITQHNI